MDLETCSICYCDFDEVDCSYKTGCKHNFHKNCIKTWYKSGHPSCNLCPICRTSLNILEIEPFSNYVPTYEEFIKLNGIYLHGSYVLIKMNSPNWKNLLKNLLVLVTISQHQEAVGNVNRTKLFIKGTNRNMTFGFILEDVRFMVQKAMGPFVGTAKPKITLSEINDIQFQNLKHLDNILLEITDNNSAEYSFIKKRYIPNDDDEDEFETAITHENAKIVASVYPFARQYNIADRTPCNYEEHRSGSCCIALIPEVTTIHNNTYYQLKCIDFALIDSMQNRYISNPNLQIET